MSHRTPYAFGFLFVAVFGALVGFTKQKRYVPPRPVLEGIHIAMPSDSAEQLLRSIAKRRQTLRLDSLTLLESDSVMIFGQPAYLQLQILHGKVRSIVVNYHPLDGGTYIDTRRVLNSYMEKYFGRGVITQDASVTHRRWETEDGTHEVSYSDKYYRLFVRLGKR